MAGYVGTPAITNKRKMTIQILDNEQIGLLLTIYAVVLFAMIIDLITGIRKARMNGEATTSKGLRKTAKKAVQYLCPMLVLTCVDVITSPLTTYPWLTAIIGIFFILTEFISVYENTHGAGSIKQVVGGVKIAVKDKDDIAKLAADVLEYLEENKKITCDGKDD